MALVRASFSSTLQTFLAGTSGLGVGNGGTGASTLTGWLLGAGTSAVTGVQGGSTYKFARDDGTMAGLNEEILIAVTAETGAVSTGTGKITFRMPFAMTGVTVRASLQTAQTSGSILTVDVNEGGVSILSTKLTIDNTEKTSTTAATAAVISDASLADDAEITIDVDQIGDGTAKGLKVLLKGQRAS